MLRVGFGRLFCSGVGIGGYKKHGGHLIVLVALSVTGFVQRIAFSGLACITRLFISLSCALRPKPSHLPCIEQVVASASLLTEDILKSVIFLVCNLLITN
jgi:hypothetical protein